MSFQTWHNYGYGICVSDIEPESVERLQQLLHLAPNFEKKVHSWLEECEIGEPVYEDYMEFDDEYRLGLATILKEVIQEAENIEFLACDDFDGRNYLIYPPNYPWCISQSETSVTEEQIDDILRKYIGILTNEELDIDYLSIETGG